MSAWTEGRRVGREQAMQRHDEMLHYYSAALDEVFRLRRALAYEAGVVEAHLTLKSFPRSRRPIAETQTFRMRLAARGRAAIEYAGMPTWSLESGMRDAGAPNSLTRTEWEHEVDQRVGDYRKSGTPDEESP